ncbi:MAG: hypothetical protein M3R17_19075 [Bacteroidota bacterium]|nr:hypothetical protein [Bacteroidota bacterium]
MTTKTNPKWTRGLLMKAAPIALFLLWGTQLMAQTSTEKKTSEGTSALEILGYVAMIIGVILLAWIIGSAQSKNEPHAHHDATKPHVHQRHFDHPNDPHFRKLKKKTS